jgi:hypothetical protein
MIKSIESNQGYALPSVLFISVVITTLCYVIIGFITVYHNQTSGIINKTKLDLACISTMHLLMSQPGSLRQGMRTIEISSLHTVAEIKQRGLYYEVEIISRDHIDSSSVRYTVGLAPSGLLWNAFVLSHPGSGLTVTGETNITGDVALQRHGIQRGVIYGEKHPRQDFMNGNVNIVNTIPRYIFDESMLENVFIFLPDHTDPDTVIYGDVLYKQMSTPREGRKDNVIHIHGDMIVDALQENESTKSYNEFFIEGTLVITENSVLMQPAIYYAREGIEIRSGAAVKNAIFISDSTIWIHRNSILEGIQVISKAGITIEGAILLYPAAVVSYDKNVRKEGSKIEIRNSVINGSVVMINTSPDEISGGGLISIDEYSKVHGFIYSTENTEIRGKITGCVYTYSTRYYYEPTLYINWLVNAQINRNALDKQFLFPVGIIETGSYGVVREQWLY